MRNILLILVLSAIFSIACGGAKSAGGKAETAGGPPCPTSPGGESPTEAYKFLFAAVKCKNTEIIKQAMSGQTQEFAQMVAGRQKTPIEKVYENGFTATTFAASLPEIRDERINGGNGAVEVWNTKESKWEDLPFVKEETGWKLAVGDLFKGTWTSPGKGRAQKEMEAANLATGGSQPGQMPNVNTNANNATIRRIIPKPYANSGK